MSGQGTNPHECRCGYPARDEQDLDDHVSAMATLNDDTHHGSVR